MTTVHPPVAECWARIDAWLAVHASASFAGLHPPAPAEAVAAAQQTMGLTFPGELLDSLACHDGQRSDGAGMILPVASPVPVRRIVDHWRMCMGVLGDVRDDDPVDGPWGEPWWHPLWIPWAHDNADSQVIDMRPGPGQGRLGVVLHDGGGDFRETWPCLGAYLHAVAQVLERGGDVDDLLPYVTTGADSSVRAGELWWLEPDEADEPGFIPAPVGVPDDGT